MENKFVSPQSSHPAKYKGVEELFSKIAKGGESKGGVVPVSGIVLALNDMAMAAPLSGRNCMKEQRHSFSHIRLGN